MKTRILFLTLFTSISVLLMAQGFAFADPITGCLEQKSGELYNVQIGTEPFPACDEEDGELTWSGNIIHQVHLEDFANLACETQTGRPFPGDTFGWCPKGSKNNFFIPDSMITPDSVVMAHIGDLQGTPGPFPICNVRFLNLAFGTFSLGFDIPVPDGFKLNYTIINP